MTQQSYDHMLQALKDYRSAIRSTPHGEWGKCECEQCRLERRARQAIVAAFSIDERVQWTIKTGIDGVERSRHGSVVDTLVVPVCARDMRVKVWCDETCTHELIEPEELHLFRDLGY